MPIYTKTRYTYVCDLAACGFEQTYDSHGSAQERWFVGTVDLADGRTVSFIACDEDHAGLVIAKGLKELP